MKNILNSMRNELKTFLFRYKCYRDLYSDAHFESCAFFISGRYQIKVGNIFLADMLLFDIGQYLEN